MTYKYEFPDFDYELPKLGDGWLDESWHNDVCPCLAYSLGEEQTLRIWFQYSNPAERECGGSKYILCKGIYGEENTDLVETDDLDEVLTYIKTNNLAPIKEQA